MNDAAMAASVWACEVLQINALPTDGNELQPPYLVATGAGLI